MFTKKHILFLIAFFAFSCAPVLAMDFEEEQGSGKEEEIEEINSPQVIEEKNTLIKNIHFNDSYFRPYIYFIKAYFGQEQNLKLPSNIQTIVPINNFQASKEVSGLSKLMQGGLDFFNSLWSYNKTLNDALKNGFLILQKVNWQKKNENKNELLIVDKSQVDNDLKIQGFEKIEKGKGGDSNSSKVGLLIDPLLKLVNEIDPKNNDKIEAEKKLLVSRLNCAKKNKFKNETFESLKSLVLNLKKTAAEIGQENSDDDDNNNNNNKNKNTGNNSNNDKKTHATFAAYKKPLIYTTSVGAIALVGAYVYKLNKDKKLEDLKMQGKKKYAQLKNLVQEKSANIFKKA